MSRIRLMAVLAAASVLFCLGTAASNHAFSPTPGVTSLQTSGKTATPASKGGERQANSSRTPLRIYRSSGAASQPDWILKASREYSNIKRLLGTRAVIVLEPSAYSDGRIRRIRLIRVPGLLWPALDFMRSHGMQRTYQIALKLCAQWGGGSEIAVRDAASSLRLAPIRRQR